MMTSFPGTSGLLLRCRWCGYGLLWAAPLLAGCVPSETAGPVCGEVRIAGTSAEANNTFDTLSATQCRLDMSGELLTLDILDNPASDTTPRVLFTLPVQGVPAGDVSLSRDGLDLSTQLPPALYQEFDPAAEDGPFWSSVDGHIEFALLANGDVIAAFEFRADNPPSIDDNPATGEVQVSGAVVVDRGLGPINTCGLTAAPAAGLLLTLGLSQTRRRRHRRVARRSSVPV